jgi:hypothetical protein
MHTTKIGLYVLFVPLSIFVSVRQYLLYGVHVQRNTSMRIVIYA